MWMVVWRLFISANTVFAYWLVTSDANKRLGLWWTLVTEIQWTLMFMVSNLYELIPISLFTMGITVKRLGEQK